MRFLYSLLFYAIQPIVLLRLLWRSLRAPAYRRRVLERYGIYARAQRTLPGGIWIHAVSVGETVASVPLIQSLARDYPGVPLIVSSMTPTGAERVEALLGDLVTAVYAPYDLPGAVARFLQAFRPRMLVIIETELWPNMIAACDRAGMPVVLANARLSQRSAEGYRRVSRLTRPMLRQLSAVAIQTRDEAERFVSLGLPEERVTVTGNIKFDMALAEADRGKAARWKAQWPLSGAAWIAASTHEGEEAIILRVHRELLKTWPELLLILVPRHPERFVEVAALSVEYGLITHRLSRQSLPERNVQVVVGDTMGDLMGLFGVADVAFVGGSLIERGGHNLLEPALWALPVLSGSHVFNFLEISRMMREGGGLLIAEDAQQLQDALTRLLRDDAYRADVGQRAYQVVDSNRGALGRLREVIDRQLKV